MFESIIESSKWSESHGAEKNFAGMGFFYYGIPYVLEAKACVCLGSGAGFVPKLMYEAQSDLVKIGKIQQINITLVDANIGPWGRPVYEGGIEGYPDIRLIKDTTDNAAPIVEFIDYLHVDADHSYDQVYKDLKNYGSKMRGDKWAITVHDTNNPSDGDHPEIGSYRASVDWSRENGFDMVNFPVGCGTALIMPRIGL
jgi:hypothetical protein